MELFIRKNTKYLICYLLLFSLPLVLMPEPIYLAVQQVEEGEKLLEEGINAVKQGAYDVAIVRLEEAISLLKDKDKLTDAFFFLGLAYFAFKRVDKVKELMNEMLKLKPKMQPDVELSPKEFLALWEEVKKENLASLFIETNPDKVDIYLDGERIGKSSLKLKDILSGEHKVRLEKDGYQSMEKFVTLVAGKENKLSFKLEKEVVKKTPQVSVTPPEKKPEVKKSKAWIWILVGAAAAAAMIVLKGGKEKGTTQPSGPITIRETGVGYNAIQEAINAASPSQHIDVSSGTYNEYIMIDKLTYLIGENKVNTIIDNNYYTKSTIVFRAGSDNAIIEGFTIKGGKTGITCDHSSPKIKNNIVSNNTYGIICKYSSANITDNTITNTGYAGISCQNNSSAKISRNIIEPNNINCEGISCMSSPTISENVIKNARAGILCSSSSAPIIAKNTINECRRGIHIEDNSKPDIGGGGKSNGNNKIRSNSDWDVYNDTYNLIKAENNCWDHNTKGEIDQYDIYGPVDFVPFKTNCSSSQFSYNKFNIPNLWLIIPSRVLDSHKSFPQIHYALVAKALINNSN